MQQVLAIILICIGVIALVTPFTPGSWLALIGLGMLLKKTPQEVLEMIKEKVRIWRDKLRRK